ncbi:MAG: glyoxylate/hydroxypyruvate reductase A [Emcibacter sp.]|nr:glyoxylate/hydroxypyruvate reductase A [Emcibacter sp.]
MTILILMPGRDCRDLAAALKKNDPTLDIRIWPDDGERADIDYIISWNHPAGELDNYPNLKVVASFGAGVDHIFNDPALPENITITRLVDDCLARQMSDYVLGAILNHRLRLTEYREYQGAGVWSPKESRTGNHVCLLGLGNIGQEVAHSLTAQNFKVSGWSQNPKNIMGVTSFQGDDELAKAISDADYIVCLLPLTPQTENILDKTFFARAKKGAYLINVGRGGHLNEDDLLDAIYNEQISGACLDVFRTEPLPDAHPFWRHPKIYITPHSASLTNIEQAALHLIENHRKMQNNQPLSNQVDRTQGY